MPINAINKTNLHKFWNIESEGADGDRNYINQDSLDVGHGLKRKRRQ